MIKTFRDKETEKSLGVSFQSVCILIYINLLGAKCANLSAAEQLKDLRVPPGNRLEKFSASRSGQPSIRINDQRRICFEWREGIAYEVEVTDYH